MPQSFNRIAARGFARARGRIFLRLSMEDETSRAAANSAKAGTRKAAASRPVGSEHRHPRNKRDNQRGWMLRK